MNMERRRSLGAWLYGPAPPPGAGEAEQLRSIRRMSVRLLPFFVPLFVVGLIGHFQFWLWLALGVFAIISLANIAVLSVRVARIERRGHQQ